MRRVVYRIYVARLLKILESDTGPCIYPKPADHPIVSEDGIGPDTRTVASTSENANLHGLACTRPGRRASMMRPLDVRDPVADAVTISDMPDGDPKIARQQAAARDAARAAAP